MRKIILILQFVSFSMLIACKDLKKTTVKSENNIDAARNFIRAALDGKYSDAMIYMLPDSVNINFLDVAERNYQRTSQENKDGYRSASINIVSIKNPVKDSVSIVIYSNSFKNNPDTLKVIKINGQWLVDFKYLYLHDSDTLPQNMIINDIIK
jgi:hypothetical protein